MATRPRRASWATFVAVHIVAQLQTAKMAILVWFTSTNHTFRVDSTLLYQGKDFSYIVAGSNSCVFV